MKKKVNHTKLYQLNVDKFSEQKPLKEEENFLNLLVEMAVNKLFENEESDRILPHIKERSSKLLP